MSLLLASTHHYLPVWHQIVWLWGGEGQGRAEGTGYLITSGPIGDLFLVGGSLALYKKFNCHTKGCPWIGRFHVEGTPYVVCKGHHPVVPKKVTKEHIHLMHKRYKEKEGQ